MSGSSDSGAAEKYAAENDAMDQHQDRPGRSPVEEDVDTSTTDVKKPESSAADIAKMPKSSAAASSEKPKSSAAASAEKPKSSAAASAENPKSSAAASSEKPKSSAAASSEKPKSSAAASAEKPKSSAVPTADDTASASGYPKEPIKKHLRYKEIQGDLFQCPDTSSMAHCVSTDLQMSKGIATAFKANFGRVNELARQRKTVGECAVLEFPERNIYYLITKKIYSHKPTYANLEASLVQMKEHCQAHGVKQLSMPQIACGLDRLAWNRVSDMIKKVFADVDISITIYIYVKRGGARGW